MKRSHLLKLISQRFFRITYLKGSFLKVNLGILGIPQKNSWPKQTKELVKKFPQTGIFLTGVEGSDPVVEGKRRDQFLEAQDFYTNYEKRLEKIKSLGINWIRLGMPYSKIHVGFDTYDFSFSDKVIEKCQELGIEIILDLLHFGLPDWMHKDVPKTPYFQNENFPDYFQSFVQVIVKRYPHIKYFTPVNEPMVTAHLSAKLGYWNEQCASDQAFIKAVINIARAAILARQVIEAIWKQEKRADKPIFIQNESLEEAVAMPNSNKEMEADKFNMYRFLALDLILGHRDERIHADLLENGISEKTYEWFMKNGSKKGVVLGIDYYPWCIHEYYTDKTIDHNITMPYQLFRLVKVYWDRYQTPFLHTEVNGLPEYAVAICQMTYDAIYKLRLQGIPIIGMAWYGDESQMDWQSALREVGQEYPVGLYRNGHLQEVGKLFSQLAKEAFPPIRIH